MAIEMPAMHTALNKVLTGGKVPLTKGVLKRAIKGVTGFSETR